MNSCLNGGGHFPPSPPPFPFAPLVSLRIPEAAPWSSARCFVHLQSPPASAALSAWGALATLHCNKRHPHFDKCYTFKNSWFTKTSRFFLSHWLQHRVCLVPQGRAPCLIMWDTQKLSNVLVFSAPFQRDFFHFYADGRTSTSTASVTVLSQHLLYLLCQV